jgi:hypothetical protein
MKEKKEINHSVEQQQQHNSSSNQNSFVAQHTTAVDVEGTEEGKDVAGLGTVDDVAIGSIGVGLHQH